jgi:ribosomal protein S17E
MDKKRKKVGLLLLGKYAKRIKGKFEHSKLLESTIYKTEFHL